MVCVCVLVTEYCTSWCISFSTFTHYVRIVHTTCKFGWDWDQTNQAWINFSIQRNIRGLHGRQKYKTYPKIWKRAPRHSSASLLLSERSRGLRLIFKTLNPILCTLLQIMMLTPHATCQSASQLTSSNVWRPGSSWPMVCRALCLPV